VAGKAVGLEAQRPVCRGDRNQAIHAAHDGGWGVFGWQGGGILEARNLGEEQAPGRFGGHLDARQVEGNVGGQGRWGGAGGGGGGDGGRKYPRLTGAEQKDQSR